MEGNPSSIQSGIQLPGAQKKFALEKYSNFFVVYFRLLSNGIPQWLTENSNAISDETPNVMRAGKAPEGIQNAIWNKNFNEFFGYSLKKTHPTNHDR